MSAEFADFAIIDRNSLTELSVSHRIKSMPLAVRAVMTLPFEG